ncbi:uncharacterized protein [Aegilops tauschii subsp. strangulata]|uniref:uncharacterized protein n=1 Tax=Aegilops tauschii subsp. strangulata TaxID=200361 RepID=UPI003CC8589A
MHEALSQPEFVRLIITLWAVWRARRKAIYEDIFTSPMSTHQFINAYLGDLQDIAAPGRNATVQPILRPTQWQRPPASLAKINVDAATKGGRRGAVAALCRDHVGNFLGASVVSFKGIGDAATLEALAVREALALAQDLNEPKIHIASDCKVVVDDIEHRSMTSYGAIIHEIIV